MIITDKKGLFYIIYFLMASWSRHFNVRHVAASTGANISYRGYRGTDKRCRQPTIDQNLELKKKSKKCLKFNLRKTIR